MIFACCKKGEGGCKFRCIFPWDSRYTIFGHGGWLERQRHVLICVLRSSSLSGTEWIQASSDRLMMEKDQCLHAPHGLTSTKQSQPSERETRAPSVSVQSDWEFKGSVSTSFSGPVGWLFRFFIWTQEVSVAWESCGPFFCPAELCPGLVLCIWSLLCRQGTLFQSSCHFIPERERGLVN